MQVDITQVSFSRAGSYLALSLRDLDDARPWEQRPGEALYLRTVHGDRETDRVFCLDVLPPGGGPKAVPLETVPFEVEASPSRLRLRAGAGIIDFCLPDSASVRVRGTGGVGLRLTLVRVGAYGNAQPYDRAGRWLVNAWAARMTYRLTPLAGQLVVTAPARTMRAERITADFLPSAGADGFEALVEECLTRREAAPMASFDEDVSAVGAAFEAYRAELPPVPERWQATADLMAYVQWSSIVAPGGHFRQPAMLMSKNHMASVWSWDHCFNALALMPHAPELAWDQFRLPFDHQDDAGALPDSVNDTVIVRSFTKPPIHGWTLRGLLERDLTGYLTDSRLETIYEPLARWTLWWLTERDQDGVPQYNHGNDSGWDNCTAFDVGFPLEGPDLSAFLILQMDTLAQVAARLGRADDAAQWRADADALLARLMAHSWRGDRFAAPHSDDHAVAQTGDSLFPFLPLVLGARLPAEVRAPLVAGPLFDRVRPGERVTGKSVVRA